MNDNYVAQFSVHQQFVQAHLKGTLNDEQPLLPAFFPPSSYWTSHEKDLFFHGLAVYSRFRPDLIAEAIKTKSTFDVSLYLDILQTASSSIPHESSRSSLEPAMEVSSRWIQNEEQMAAALLQLDSCTWTPADRETNRPLNPEPSEPSTQIDSPIEEGLSNPPKSPVIAPSTMVDNSKLEAYQLRKRLYMRRKRAQSTGKSINTEAIRLRRGRQLASKNDVDFFHMSSLARLTRSFGSLNNLTRPVYETSISADTIQLLVAILTEFTSEVVRGTLVSKEQEIRLKGTLKVWKYDPEEINAENVRETLKFMGIARPKSKDYLAELVGEGDDGISLPDRSNGMEMGSEDDNNGDSKCKDIDQDNGTFTGDTVVDPSNASDTSEQSAEALHALREFWVPESFSRCLLPKHIQVSENDSDFLSDIDEIELGRQLEEEEEELDARDLLASKEFEAGLWGS